jgi:DNA end-binding protein Ku
MPRPYWKGYLRLSLVSCPVALYPATSGGERVSFRQINKKTGNRLRQQLVDDVTREVVPTEDKGRGYEVDKNTFIMVEDEEIEAIQIESSHTIEIDSFVPREQIDQRYRESPYYIAPNDQVGQEAFAVIREAMRGKQMVALGRIVLSKRERVVMLEAMDQGLLATTLRYPYEVREAAEYFDDIADIKVQGEMLKLAEHILETKRAEFDPSQFVDHYETALVEMLKEKQDGAIIQKPAAERPSGQVINLMDALKRSIAGDGKAAPASAGKAAATSSAKAAASSDKAPSAKKAKKGKSPQELRTSPQFKFPIKGGKGREAEAPAKPVPAKAPAKAPAAKSGARRKSA